MAQHENFKLFTDDPPNQTDVAAALKGVQGNDAALKEVNLNNMKVIGHCPLYILHTIVS